MLPGSDGLWPIHVELFYDEAWQDITDDVDVSDGIRITRGRQDYQSSASPAQCEFLLNNDSGVYSARNPESPLYGKIGRNTPVRVRVGEIQPAVRFPGWRAQNDSRVWTPDEPALDISGEIDLRADLDLDRWVNPADTYVAQMIATKHAYLAEQFSWNWMLRRDGLLRFGFSTTGTAASHLAVNATEPVPVTSGRLAVRVVCTPDDGAGQRVYRYYSGPSIDGPWTQLGDTITAPAEGLMFVGNAPVVIGSAADHRSGWSDVRQFGGVVHAFQVRDGQDGPIVADFAAREVASTPWTVTDSVGRAWHGEGRAVIVDTAEAVRFTGHVSAWPPRWDDPEHARTPIEAYGARRLVDRSSTPLRSSMFRGSTNPGNMSRTVAYWPMEDGRDASEFASGIGGTPMRVGRIPGYHVRDIAYAAYSDFLASEPLPEFHITAAVGTVPWAPPTGELRVYALVRVPDDGVAVDTTIMSVSTTGTVAEWRLQVTPTGAARLRGVDANGTAVLQTGALGAGLNGRRTLLGIWLRQQGGDIAWQVFRFTEDSTAALVWNGTLTGRTVGSATSVAISPYGDLKGTAVGHVTVMNTNTESLWGPVIDGFHGHAGEPAAERVARLGAEEETPVVVVGEPDDTEPLDVQDVGTLSDLLDEAAESDLGSLHDRRDLAALEYRTRTSLYNQAPVTLDYCEDPIVSPFEPTDDDADLENDVTVTRRNGSSYRAVKETGPLAAVPPPEGVGRIDASYTLSLADDAQVAPQAQWRLHMGTIDELRYPKISVALHSKPELAATLGRVDVGDRVQVTRLPRQWVDALADVIVQGYTEYLDGIEWRIEFNCTPASAWTVGVFDDEVYGRADTAGSVLLADVDAEQTVIPVLTTDGPRWIEDTAAFPFDIQFGGEIATVTGVRSLLSDDFGRGDVGRWDDPDRGVWDQTLKWGE